jgi:peptide/nickel transport system substrate-binding protein
MRMAHIRSGLAASCAALVFAACGTDAGDPGADVGPASPGGTAVVAVTSDFQAFNPVTNTALVTLELINFALFTPLVQYDENFEPSPWLAESWDLADDHVVMRLRDDVFWHDGERVTSEDVVFTFEMAKNPESASLLESAYLTMVSGASVIDANTVRFDFVAPHSQPMDAFWWAPVPRHLLDGVAPAQLAQHGFNRNPVGSGPFRFVSWDSGQQVTLEANDRFPEALGGRPMLDRIVFRIVPESTTRLTELLTGAVDLNYTVLPDEAQQVDQQRNVRLNHYPSREFLYVGWNNEREPFQDPRVRRALAHAIDRDALIEALMFGYAELASAPILPFSPLDPGIDGVGYDPDAARRLLAEAGYTPGPDGVLRGPAGPLRFSMMVSENRLRQDLATVIQSQLRQVGVDMQLRVMEFQTLLAQHRARDYQSVLSGWSMDNFRVDPMVLFSCEEARREQSPNRAGYCNPEADRLMQAGLREMDAGAARGIWRDFGEILQQDQPITFLFWVEDMAGVAPRLQGADMDARGKMVNVQRWWIPEGQRR